jgi:subtilase family serine protease
MVRYAYAIVAAVTTLLACAAAGAGTAAGAQLPANRHLRIAVVLKPRDPAALTRLAQAVSDPSSTTYRHYLSRTQFTRRFAPSAAEVGSVEASLRSRGLRPGRVSANGLSIPIEATARALERAFATELTDVRRSRRTAAVIDASAPALPARVAGNVQAVVGLTSLDHMVASRVPAPRRVAPALVDHAASSPHIATGGPLPCAAAARDAPQQSAYTSDQIASAYGFGGLYAAGDEGAGVTIAVYELESNDPADIAAYQACYHTHARISYVPVDGGVRPGTGSGEAALDLEQLVSLAPKANLIVYQAPNSNSNGPGAGPYDVLSTIVSQDAASVVSDSWGQCESEEGRADAAAENVLLEEAAVQGQTILASAGDSGAQDCDIGGNKGGNTSLTVDDPASQPFVTGVGGTSLTAIGPPPTETAWNSAGQADAVLGGAGAGGGGISALWPMPSYQSGAPASLDVSGAQSSGAPCRAVVGLCREVPDVSANADPNYGYLIYFNGSGARTSAPSGWQGTGGTSAAAPLWAAVIALADANPACGGIPVGFANPTLYALAAAAPGTYFHDVTSGDNDLTGTAGGLFPATPGYDMATGLGSPDAAALAPALCAATLRVAGPRSELTFAHTPVSVSVSAAAPSGQTLTYVVRGLPRGLRFDAATAAIAGRPVRVGRYRVRIEAIDSGGTDRVFSFRWTVAGRPRVSGLKLVDTAGGQPSLSLTVEAGAREPALRRLSLRLPGGIRFARSLTGLSVTGANGRSLAHGASVRHGVLELRLHSASREIRFEFAGGSLVGAGRLAGTATTSGAGRIVVTVHGSGTGGGDVTVHALLKSRS